MPIYTARNTEVGSIQDIDCDVCIIGSGRVVPQLPQDFVKPEKMLC